MQSTFDSQQLAAIQREQADHGARINTLERDHDRLTVRLDQILLATLVGAGGAIGGLVLYVFSLLKR